MRLFGLGCLLLCMGSSLSAQTPGLPKDHPPVATPDSRSAVSDLTERLRPSTGETASKPIPRKNLIDEFIFGKIEKDRVPHASLSSDEEFFRRLHIDLTGRLPQDDELRAFLTSTDPDKRDTLVDRLATSKAYETKWTYFFNDIYKPAPGRIGNAAKNLFYRWVYDNIHLDRPYNQIVSEMLTANAISNWYIGPASYVARWVVTAVSCDDEVHEDTSDELAIHATKDFLGVDISCASCHDGARHLEKINVWLSERKRDEIWKMAAFFGRTNVLRRTEVSTAQDEYSIDDNGPGYDPSARTVIRVDRRGKPGLLDPVYMFTGERPDPSKHPRPEFARMLTSDPQFARATVNLLWSEMFGVGIVEPIFSFDLARVDPNNPPSAPWTLQPTHPELLEALAQYFRDSNYSLRSVVKLIAKSNAYQLSSQFPGEWKTSYAPYFARKFVRRLKAEEVYDSLVGATNLFTDVPIRGTDVKVRFASEAYSPDEFIRGINDPVLKEIHFFLESFGQTNRQSSERSNDGAITQAVQLMNSPLVHRQIRAAEGSYLSGLLKQALPEEEKINRMFERFLVRRPTPDELTHAKKVVAGGPEGWEDLQWLLVNRVEFVHNF
ncbi:MAG: DUF1553 domain-containing protein [Vicinamibacterales bacterium]